MCPSCKSIQVRRSRGRRIQDRIMKLVGLFPYRCRECNRRFYVTRFIDEKLRREKRREEQRYAHVSEPAAVKPTL